MQKIIVQKGITKMPGQELFSGEDDIKFLIATRKNLRSSVTRIYNDRNNFSSYEEVKLNTLKSKVDNLKTDLCNIDVCISKKTICD